MPKAEITRVVVPSIHEDGSTIDIIIRKGKFDDRGTSVSIDDDGQTVYVYPCSWPDIRDQIQGLIDSIEDDCCAVPEE